jgi:PPM family protein phosphatase
MEKNPSVSLRVGAGAHQGLVREENQDRISRVQSPCGELFIVADGMGGYEGGATAAQMLIDGLTQHLRAVPPGMPPDEALRQATERANAEIYRRRAQGSDPRLARMGTTGVLALVQGHRAWIAHAGDSRAYLWRGGDLRRLTRDHTLVQGMVDRQILDEEEARNHPDAHVVTRSFGQRAEIEMEIAPALELLDGDRLLLCSDGLSGSVDDAAIARVLAAQSDTQTATDALIGLALQAGGSDNISVQLIAVQMSSPREASAAPPPPAEETAAAAPRRGVSGFLLLLPLILVALLAGVLLPWRDWLAPDPLEPPETVAQEPPVSEMPAPIDLTDPYAAPGPAPEAGPGPDAIRPPAAEPAPGRAPQSPRVTVLSPTGARIPEVKQRVLREYPGNWSTPETLEDRLAGALAESRVYFRAGFGPAATALARELGVAALPWPESLRAEHPEADLLVIYPSPPSQPSRPAPGGAP